MEYPDNKVPTKLSKNKKEKKTKYPNNKVVTLDINVPFSN